MKIDTHKTISEKYCGKPVQISPGSSEVVLTTLKEMAVDAYGLIHGGFVFGLADHAAMIAVNHPNVVLGAAEVRFLKPVKIGDTLTAVATIISENNRKIIVETTVRNETEAVFSGTFTCFVLNAHVLSERLEG